MGRRSQRIQQRLQQQVEPGISCQEGHDSIILEGSVDNWAQVVRAGKLAAHEGYKGVVNRLAVRGLTLPAPRSPKLKDTALDGRHVDVLIVGGGVTGCALARELTRKKISVLLVEKEDDLATHASSRNNGMIHPGIEPHPGTRKAHFNVRGNAMYDTVAAELDVPFARCGSLILYQERWERFLGPLFMARARQNGVPGVRLISKSEALSLEPHLTREFSAALHMPSTGIISPYLLTVAYAENAVRNGAAISLETMVVDMKVREGRITAVRTNRGTLYPRVVVNAAGLYADTVADMAGDQFFTIHPRKGEIIILDRKTGHLISHVVAKPRLLQVKSDTKGGGINRTIDGNILVGPNALEQPFREDYSTDRDRIELMLRRYLPLVPELSSTDLITYFASTRPATYEEDFVVERSQYVRNLVHAAGIQSPGLASAPAIAAEVARMTADVLGEAIEVADNPTFDGRRHGIPDPERMTWEERDALIHRRSDYGVIVCRCEGISKGQVVDALRSPIPVASLDAVKRRVRAGMGRCQGGFCTPQVLGIIGEQNGGQLEAITKKGGDSFILATETKSAQRAP
ncbi:MAG TPA: NAD(P)/FAD-dependent oxidoreductase [Clostridia bacterium]|nr:NAD(P)/FAD-dependent oxidoreductase [Clostridia bacterium]